MLHLVTAWKTVVREGDPEVLYCGLSAESASKAALNAPAGTLRVEKAFVHDSFKIGFKTKTTPRAEAQAPADARGPELHTPMESADSVTLKRKRN